MKTWKQYKEEHPKIAEDENHEIMPVEEFDMSNLIKYTEDYIKELDKTKNYLIDIYNSLNIRQSMMKHILEDMKDLNGSGASNYYEEKVLREIRKDIRREFWNIDGVYEKLTDEHYKYCEFKNLAEDKIEDELEKID